MAISKNILTSEMKIIDETNIKKTLSSSQSAMSEVDEKYPEYMSGTLRPTKFEPNVEYEIISDIDVSAMQINLKKGVPIFVSGATAEELIKRGRGHIKLYDVDAVKKAKEEKAIKEEVAELKEVVKELKKTKSKKTESETKK